MKMKRGGSFGFHLLHTDADERFGVNSVRTYVLVVECKSMEVRGSLGKVKLAHGSGYKLLRTNPDVCVET